MSQFQSQSWSQSEDPPWASIPFVKFSHVLFPAIRSCPAWTHGDYPDLRLVIQTFRVVDDHGNFGRRAVMKVFSEAVILESQNLSQLVRIFQRDASLVEVVGNSPRVAMRYPKDPDKIWKCQMRFSNDGDYAIFINAIRDLGLPIKSQTPKIQVLPSPAPSSVMSSSPALSAGSLQSLKARPISASSNPPVDRSASRAKLPPYAEFKVPERPATTESLRQRPSSSHSRPGSSQSASDSFVSSVSLPAANQPPTTSFCEPSKPLYFSQPDRESQNRRSSQPMSYDPRFASTSSQATSSILPRQMQLQQADDGERSTSGPQLLSRSPFFPVVPKATANLADQSLDPFRTLPTPTFHTSASIQDLTIPPRRELPFDRPVSTPAEFQDPTVPSRQELPFSRPERKPGSSSIAELPPLPKPTPLINVNLNRSNYMSSAPEPAKAVPIKGVAQRKASASKAPPESASVAVSPLKPLSRETTIAPPTLHEDAPSPLAAKSAAASRPASAASGLISKTASSAKKRIAAPIRPPSSTKRPKMVDQSTQTQTLSGRDHTVKERMHATTSVPEVDPPNISTVPPPVPPQSYLDELDAFVANHRARPAPRELWQVPGYAEADADRRHMMLNDFICQNLENPDFLRLCADTENAWRRLGLGM
ncbi:hypothetical protein BKA65DRAFT_537026 [Rhexocercosporidium sp. MPI-PUGE-AT-0058]|nr:hypothetical protein BKA65DRAFT_537026 [Rhexocercosporidium sp. MPI-PUGE-AT-0058]